jgi:hypothetical protein
MLNSLTKFSRIISLRHVIVTFGTCLNCQSLSAVKDMHTSISVVVRQGGAQAVSDNSAESNISSPKSNVGAPLPPRFSFPALHSPSLVAESRGLHGGDRCCGQSRPAALWVARAAQLHHQTRGPSPRDPLRDGALCRQGPRQSTAHLLGHLLGRAPHLVGVGHHSLSSDRHEGKQHKGDRGRCTAGPSLPLSLLLCLTIVPSQTLVESIRDSLSATLVSVSQGRLCSTTFQFLLPIPGSPLGASLESAMWRPRSLRAPWILIVDDSAVSRKLVRRNILRLIPEAEVRPVSSLLVCL